MYKITILHQKSYPMKERGNTVKRGEKKFDKMIIGLSCLITNGREKVKLIVKTLLGRRH